MIVNQPRRGGTTTGSTVLPRVVTRAATARLPGRLGAAAPYDDLVASLAEAGLDPSLVPTAARTLLHFVLGHVTDEQTHLQAGSAGAIDGEPLPESDFVAGLGLVLDGIRLRARGDALDRSGIEKQRS